MARNKRKKRGKGVPALIKCGDHKWAPWAIICIHLLERPEATVWLPLENKDNREVDFDYICPACADRRDRLGGFDKMIDFLRPICIHCLRWLRHRAGLDDTAPTPGNAPDH